MFVFGLLLYEELNFIFILGGKKSGVCMLKLASLTIDPYPTKEFFSVPKKTYSH